MGLPKYRNFPERVLTACPNCTSFCGDHDCRLPHSPLSLLVRVEIASLLIHQSNRQHGHTNVTSTLRTPVDTGCGFQGQSSPLEEDLGASGRSAWVHTILSLRIVGLSRLCKLTQSYGQDLVQGSQQQVFVKQNRLGSLEKRNLWGKDQ